MQNSLSIIVLGIVLVLTTNLVHAKDFYVSPQGDDANPGTEILPFKTLEHVKNIVRTWKKSNENEDITVWLFGGEYRLSETLVFGLQDAAGHGSSITYAAVPGSTPVINSDITITGWKKLNKLPKEMPKKARGNIWVAPVPVAAADLKIVYNAHGMLPRARTKAIAHMRESEDWRGGDELHQMIPFKKGTTKELFNPQNTEIVVIPAAPWTMNILPVKSVDHETGMVYLGTASTYALAAPRFYMGPEAIWVENTFAGLDEAGEWVYDAEEGSLYYWPEDGKNPGNDIVAPQLIEMIRIEGQIDYDGPSDVPVKGLNFQGITFTHGNRFESAGLTGLGLQHDWERFDESTALVRFRGAENCSIENCFFIHSGGTAIRLDLHAKHIRIHNNELS